MEEDKGQAVKWYRQAAEQGDSEAQFNLGLCYENGEGVPKDLAEAVKWYRKAAEQNDADAQFNLGACYANGEGVSKNMAEAVKWYRKAAEQGDADAKAALEANRKGFKYYLSNALTIIAFFPAIVILTAVGFSALRKCFATKSDPNQENR